MENNKVPITGGPGFIGLKQLLYSDLARQAELDGKPVARPGFRGLLRRLLHPRFLPIVLCRASRAARLRKIPVLPELLTYLNIVLFGLEVTPRCEIGPGIFFPHPSGTVIGAWRIGSNATILQGVTLGAKRMDLGFDFRLRPEVGNNVVDSVEAGSTVVGIPARKLPRERPQNADVEIATLQ